MFGRSYQLPLRLLGIPLRVDASFLVMLPLMAWMVGSQAAALAAALGLADAGARALSSPWSAYPLGLAAAAGVFAGVYLHELGHALVARALGTRVRSITLWLLGGVADIDEVPARPIGEAAIAAAGPAVSFALAGGCWLALRVAPAASSPMAVRFLLAYLAWMHLCVAVFNLLPALPLDGGRVLRSLLLAAGAAPGPVARVTSALGRAVVLLLALAGFVSFNFFLMLVAGFIYLAGEAETRVGRIEAMLRGVRVRDLMNPDVRTVPPDIRVAELTRRMLAERHLCFPVADDAGRLHGIVEVADVANQDPTTPVGALMRRQVPTIMPDAEAADAMRMMGERGVGRVVVTDGDGRIAGIVTRTDLLRLLSVRDAGLAPAGSAAPGAEGSPVGATPATVTPAAPASAATAGCR